MRKDLRGIAVIMSIMMALGGCSSSAPNTASKETSQPEKAGQANNGLAVGGDLITSEVGLTQLTEKETPAVEAAFREKFGKLDIKSYEAVVRLDLDMNMSGIHVDSDLMIPVEADLENGISHSMIRGDIHAFGKDFGMNTESYTEVKEDGTTVRYSLEMNPFDPLGVKEERTTPEPLWTKKTKPSKDGKKQKAAAQVLSNLDELIIERIYQSVDTKDYLIMARRPAGGNALGDAAGRIGELFGGTGDEQTAEEIRMYITLSEDMALRGITVRMSDLLKGTQQDMTGEGNVMIETKALNSELSLEIPEYVLVAEEESASETESEKSSAEL